MPNQENKKRLWITLGLYAAILVTIVVGHAIGNLGIVPVALLVGAIAGTYLGLDPTPRPEGRKPMLLSALDGLVATLVLLPLFFGLLWGLQQLGGEIPVLSKAGWIKVVPHMPKGAVEQGIPQFLLIQVVGIAVPEELFFRATLQKGLDGYFGMKWKILKIDFGWGLVLASILFGLAHIFRQGAFGLTTALPGVLFGLLYEKRQSVVGPVIFHAACNITMLSLIKFGH